MIAHLTGKILNKQPNQLVLDVHGVGYELMIPLSTFYDLGEPGGMASVHVHTHVREDTISLYGFRTLAEKQLFEKLISVSGIGPKLGIAILSGMSADELIPTLQRSDVARLTHIPGVGKKTAERLTLELRDKLGALTPAEEAAQERRPSGVSQTKEDAVSALVNLGYPYALADKAVREVLRADSPDLTFENLLRLSLQFLTR